MDTTEDSNSANADTGACLAHCLRFTEPYSTSQAPSATTEHRSRLTSTTDVVSSPSLITAWLDWLLSEQVAEAFVKVILQIPSPLKGNSNGGKLVPGLSLHGRKQLLTDLG